jgi:TolA-binding protein
MSSEKQHSPQHEELLKRQALEQQEVKEVLVFIRKYAKPAAIIVIVICAVLLGDKLLKTNRYKKEAAAESALMKAQNAEDLQAVIDDYASTPSKPLAMMGLAREKFNGGQIDEAEALYTQLTKKYSTHEMALQAKLNLISCKEAKGQLSDAHLLYGEFASAHPASYLAPSAMLSKARCLEALNLLDEAQIAYEDVIVNYPEGTWAQIAEANLKIVLGKK